MLILVGVTINFALNGGIINKAKQASSQMQIEADREALLTAVIASIGLDGKVDFSELNTEAAKMGFTGSNGTYTSKAGNTFTVDENGNITYTGEGGQTEDSDLTYLKSLIGQKLGDIMADMSGPVFNDPNIEMDNAELENMSTDDLIDNGDGTYTINYPILYKNKPYSMTVRFIPEDQANSTILDARTRIASSSSSNSSSSSSSSSESEANNLGRRLTYNGIDYIVFAEDKQNGTVDLISANAIGSVTLGSDSSESDARDSYNNLVETLVTACKNETGLTVDGTDVISIRSVGNENVKYTSSGITGSDNPGTYTYDWQAAGVESDWYTANGYNSYNMKAPDENYLSDYNAMQTLGITQADNNTDYWLASRLVTETRTEAWFYSRFINNGYVGQYDFYDLFASNYCNYYDVDYAIRPIVTLNASAISEYLD